jgi:ribonuclease I
MTRTVHYGNNEPFTIANDSLTPEQIKTEFTGYFPELANASIRVEGNNIYFEVKAGTKGMARTVHYGNNEPFTIANDSLTPEQIKTEFTGYFPELANASIRVEGDNIYFEVKAGTKGMARTVHYGNNEPFTIANDSLTPEQIKTEFTGYFPELANASIRVEGDNIYFEVKAGTKGVQVVAVLDTKTGMIYGKKTLE